MATDTSTQPSPAQIAKLRRQGATWNQVIEATGLKTNSTGFAAILARGGFDRRGLKLDGSGPRETKARVNAGRTTKSAADLVNGSRAKSSAGQKQSRKRSTSE